jgi:hypothetical protein
MAQQKPLANLSAEISKLKAEFNAYKNVKSAITGSAGTTATGTAKVTDTVWKSMKGYFNKFPELFFGKNTTNSADKASNPTDYGIAYLSALLASIDLCSIITTIGNLSKNLQGSSKFNPNQNPPPNDPKWKIQLVAYYIQNSIDIFEAAYAMAANPSTMITSLLSEIGPNMTKLTGPDYLSSPDIRKSYPQVDAFNNFIADTLKRYSNVTIISPQDKKTINGLLKSITLLRQICVLIQGLTSPASLVSFAASALDPATFKAIDKLGVNNINPQDLSRTIASLQTVASQIDHIMEKVVNAIEGFQALIKILLVLVKVFKVIVNFLQILPIPNMYTTAGFGVKMARTTDKLDQYAKDTIKILNEINLIIAIVVGLIQGVVATVNLIIANLNKILLNLQNCDRNNQDPAIQALTIPLAATIDNMVKSNDNLAAFVQNYQAKKSNTANTYYGYTIQILTEDISDPQVQKVTIPRRYGIALNSANIAVVETTPTYASDDNVIIGEVKLLLQEKHLIQSQGSALTAQEQAIVTESMNILGDNSITMDDIPVDDPTALMDPADNENDNLGLGVNSFFNKQKGGKKLRNKIKKIMQDQKTKLGSDLQKAKK